MKALEQAGQVRWWMAFDERSTRYRWEFHHLWRVGTCSRAAPHCRQQVCGAGSRAERVPFPAARARWDFTVPSGRERAVAMRLELKPRRCISWMRFFWISVMRSSGRGAQGAVPDTFRTRNAV
jgi:hypothetical protein